PSLRPLNTTVYKAQVLPADAEFPANGLPVFHLTERNDDGGPGYGADSRFDFVAPADGDYLVHLKDVRNLGGPGFERIEYTVALGMGEAGNKKKPYKARHEGPPKKEIRIPIGRN
ncbi:MAG: hypothetical protein ACXVC4_21165, partial [Bdellovibrionota bacterium]